jgi:heterodisulfide reductase subunit C
MDIKRTIKYEADRVEGFGREVMAVPGCEALEHCIQCGTCSGVCPLSIYMDYTPRQVMELVRSDFKNEVLQSHTIWLCASCYACTTECPRQIRITDILYELKQRAIKEGVYPRRFPIPVLAEEFTRMVHDHGRISETWLVSKMYLRTNPLAALGMAGLGLALMKTGRFSLKQDHIERREELAKIMEAVDQENGKAKA